MRVVYRCFSLATKRPRLESYRFVECLVNETSVANMEAQPKRHVFKQHTSVKYSLKLFTGLIP